ncbi:MAG: hypothetical protein R2764_20220 [Bacteroidales bacterium]
MIRFRLSLFIFLFNGLLFGQDISFFKENLYFKINSDNFEVDGLYYFRNLTNNEIRQLLFYPFPDSEKYGEISFIEIRKESDTVSQIATVSDNGSLFKLFIDPNGESVYHIRYSQQLKSNRAKYIITTTQQWGIEFEQADYTLEFQNNVQIDTLSIKPDTIILKPDYTQYIWHRENFMPEEDFIFWLSKRGEK